MVGARCSHAALHKLTFLLAAIIFLAPISGFDQTLAEDKSVNRLVCFTLLAPYGTVPLIGRRLIGRLRVAVEISLLKQALGEGRPCTLPQQVRHLSLEAAVWHSTVEVRAKLRGATERC